MQKTSLNLRLHSLIGNSSSRSKEQEARLRRTQLCQINLEVEFAHVRWDKKRPNQKIFPILEDSILTLFFDLTSFLRLGQKSWKFFGGFWGDLMTEKDILK